MTTWRTHPIHSCYQVSDDGRIRSTDRLVRTRWGTTDVRPGRELKLSVSRGGYLQGKVSTEGIPKNFHLHVLVCEAFHGLRPSPRHEVRHINGKPLDNRPDNLCWGTKSQNERDKALHGTHWCAKRTHCKYGHPFDAANTIITKKGSRTCRECKNSRRRKGSQTAIEAFPAHTVRISDAQKAVEA